MINLKKLVLSFVIPTVFSTYLIGQESTITLIKEQTNGVKVYQQVGVISPQSTLIEEKQIEENLIDNWTESDCEMAIYYILKKIDHLKDDSNEQARIENYKKQLEAINNRLQSLKEQYNYEK